jgi:DNA-binding GntR family transcriptional regulator
MNNGYSICFNEWALDKSIKNELGLLLIISSLTAEKGYCYASNEYLAKQFKTSTITISRKLGILKSKGYITIEYDKRGYEVIGRKIRLTKMLTDDYQKRKPTINKNVKYNNTSNNNTSIINIKNFKNNVLEEELDNLYEN